jgi:hypothetical protein
MIEKIEYPAALALVRWIPAEEGGRRSGPPTALVYAANCTFPLGGESELIPGWPATAEKLSLLLEQVGIGEDGRWTCKVDFLVPELAGPYLVVGAPMLVMEGPKVVGEAVITEVFEGTPDLE